MAKLSSDGTYVTVEKGDTLSEIAEDYAGGASNYKKLAAINDISNPNLIYVGQVIYLTEEAKAGSSSSSSSSSTTSNVATITHFGLQSNSDNTLFAQWSWSKSNTAKFKVLWTYTTGDGVWFTGSNKEITYDEDAPSASRQDTYSIPSNATSVVFKVKPISKTYTKNDTETSYWTAEWSEQKRYNVSDSPPKTPDTPDVTIEQYKLTAELENLDLNATSIQFQIVKDDSTVFNTGTANIVTSAASYSCTVDAGGKYKVRCRSCRDDVYSDWSQYSSNVETVPAASSGITTIKATSETSVYLEWEIAGSAKTYELEYTTKKEYFDGSDQTTTVSGIESNHYEKTGLESGQEYFFRVRAVNDKGSSAWTEPKSVIIGEDPSAPTTWSSTTTAMVGEELILYWVHNSADGSSQTFAELELYIDDTKETHTIRNTEDEDEKDKTSSYVIDTTKYSEGTTLQWRVRTAGVTNTYGDWSVQRTVDIYAPPTLELGLKNADGSAISTITSFPFYISALAGPKTQAPIGYHLSIISEETYETVDVVGNPITVNAGDAVYSKYFDITTSLLVELSANHVDLENNVNYTIECSVSMNSGLSSTATLGFNVTWTETWYEPTAEIGIDTDTYTASIRPYCEKGELVRYMVTRSSSSYTKTSTKLGSVYGEIVQGATTTTGEKVWSGVDAEGTNVYYCEAEERTAIEDVYLSVYRREFDGSFTELATGLDGAKTTTITDPHPALDYARYRIVAISKDTGTVSYSDPAGYPVGGVAAIIQWNEAWSSFDSVEEAALEEPAWSGSLVKLPYNLDVSDSNAIDVELIEYIGRSHPVSYYGTQIGSSSRWNVEIPKSDIDTLYALRRLSRWMGDVYVREPSGSGYWANIAVSFSQKHCDVTIPVSLSITRVEGGA